MRLSALSTVVRREPAGKDVSSILSGKAAADQSTAVHPYDKQLGTWGKAKVISLFQNYPNPFNPGTWLPFQLTKDSDVTVNIYDIEGNLVRTLELGSRKMGSYVSNGEAAYWDGKNGNGETVTSGIYFYSIKAGNSATDVRKMSIIR